MDYPTVTVRIDHGVPSAEVAIVAKPDDGNLVEVCDDCEYPWVWARHLEGSSLVLPGAA